MLVALMLLLAQGGDPPKGEKPADPPKAEKPADPPKDARTAGEGKADPKPDGKTEAPLQKPLGVQDFVLLLPLIALVFYLVVLRPAAQKRAEGDSTTTLQKNDKVLILGGLYGSVVSVAEKEDEVLVKVDDNLRLRLTKAAINKNLSHEERQKAAAEKKKETPKA